MPPAPTRRQLQAILNTPENPPMTSQHHFYGNAPTSGSPRSYRTESNFNPKYDNFIQTGSDMPCAEYARTLPAGEEPGPRGAPPSETARTERSRRRGWRGRRAPLPPSQASRGVGHRPPLQGSRAPAPAPPTPQLRGRGGARPLRSAGTHGLPCGRAGGRSRPDGVRGRAGTGQAPCGGERQQKGLPGAGPLGERAFSQDFTFPGALAAAGWGLPGLGGTGKSREQRHVSAYRHHYLPELPRGAAGQDGAAAPSTLGGVVRPADFPKWRRGPVAAEGRMVQCWGCFGHPAFSRPLRILRFPPRSVRGLEEGTAGGRDGHAVSGASLYLPTTLSSLMGFTGREHLSNSSRLECSAL